MGRQVPDLSPEGLKELSQLYRENVDRSAVESLLLTRADQDGMFLVLERWRKSAGISKVGVSRLLGMSKMGYFHLEDGDTPITERFLESLRALLVKLDTTGFDFHPSDRKSSAPRYNLIKGKAISKKSIKSHLYERRCANPNCKTPWFLTAYPLQKYCSQKCSDYVAQHRKIGKVVTRQRVPKTHRPLLLRCPQCQNEFIAKGNIINGSPGGRIGKHNSYGKSEADGKTNHDETGEAQ